MPIIQRTWSRGTHLTKFGQFDPGIEAGEGLRAQQKAKALMALKSMLTASEYEVMADQCQRGEREVRLVNGFVITCLSPTE
jgi:hypothetical protein